jgi:sigma-B regulation protein RsbU (phosphoserine phosphatase)
VLVLLGVSFVLAGQITGPLRALVQAVSRINKGNLSYRSTMRRRDELGQLSRALEDMVDNIAAGEEAYEKVLEHESEVQMATELKNALLPKQLPSGDGFEVAALHTPGTRGVADFYDAVPLEGGRAALIVASSSGKGALGVQVATLARSLLHAYLDSGVDPKEALFRTNRQLSRGMRKGLHLTAQMAVLDPARSRATVYVAGHRAPFYSCRAGEVQVVHGEGLALGLDKGPVFERRLEEVNVDMPPGTRIVMTTVGTYEFETSQGKKFGLDAFQSLVRKHAPKNTEAFLSLVLGQMQSSEDEQDGRELDAILVTAKRMA